MTNDAPPIRKRRARSGVMMLLVLVACVAVGVRAWQYALDDNPVPKLLRAMRTGTEEGRIEAMESIWLYPPAQSRVAASTLLEGLRDPSPRIRAAAATGLGHIHQMGHEASGISVAAEGLRVLVDDPDPAVRCVAIATLKRIYQPPSAGPRKPVVVTPTREVASAVVAALKDAEPTVRREALEAIPGTFATPDETREILLAAARDPDESVRAVAVRELGGLAGTSSEACLVVVRAMRDPSERVRDATQLLPTVAIPVEAVPDLIAVLRGVMVVRPMNHTVPIRAFAYLQQIGPAAKEAIPVVAAIARGGMDEPFRSYAVRTLGAIAPGSPEAKALIPDLLAGLKSPDMGHRFATLADLAAFTWDPEVVAALQRATTDPDALVRTEAIKSLGRRFAPEPDPEADPEPAP